MFFSDPFRRRVGADDPVWRRRARWACRLLGGSTALAMIVGLRVAPSACEPFLFVALAVMIVAIIAGDVL
jgi:hypothetical protein